MASPVLPAPSTGFTSDQLTPATVYTRAQLRTLFAIADASLDASVFRPSGYRSVWLFATASLIGSSGTDALMLDQDTLQWAGQPAGRTNQLIITHELRGLELLVFYRASPAQYPSEGFRYLGRFEYYSHVGDRPALFTLTRSGSAPSLALIQAEQDKAAPFHPASIRDGREWVLASIVRRRGQAAFRAKLLTTYGSACAVTGCAVEPLLEAAHIIPYLGPTTNHVQNGLLLRADIHTLFDLQLLAIEPEPLTIALSPTLVGTEYAALAGKLLRLPAQPTTQPSRDALRAHRIRCAF